MCIAALHDRFFFFFLEAGKHTFNLMSNLQRHNNLNFFLDPIFWEIPVLTAAVVLRNGFLFCAFVV